MVSDKSKCNQDALERKNVCLLSNDKYCDLVRRYAAFAVSKTEDPRDGFHQYMITENNTRDWPWMAVNGDAFVVSHKGDGSKTGPVATVFSVRALAKGERHPPYFRYYSKNVNDINSVMPPQHQQNAAGLTFLLGNNKGLRLDIFAFPQVNDPWTAPSLLKRLLTLVRRSRALWEPFIVKAKCIWLTLTRSKGRRENRNVIVSVWFVSR